MEESQNPQDSQQQTQRLKTLFRQNSKKFGFVAENVVLPMNKRSIKRGTTTGPIVEMILMDVESQNVSNIAQHEPSVVYGPTIKEYRSTPQKEFPIFMISISCLQGILFYYGGDLIWLYLCYDPFRRHELWRYFTIMMVHSSASHLWGNLVFQLILGVLLEIVHHWKRIATIYLCGVIGGSLAITIFTPESYGVGASAGVYALFTAHLATIIINWKEMDKKCCRLFWLLVYIGFDVGLNCYIELVLEIDTNTSHAGHFGGALAGFVAAVFFLRNFEKLAWEKVFQKMLAVAIIILFVIVVLINIISLPSHYFPTHFNTRYIDTYHWYIIKTVNESAPDSDIRKICLENEECKLLLNQFVNGTLTDTD